MSLPDLPLIDFLREQGLATSEEQGVWTPLAGGVSSDIWRVETSLGTWCVKRALPLLKVEARWEAPIDRNAFEWAYLQVASRIAPGSVPEPIAHDESRGVFAMAWLAPDSHPLWKTELLAGRVDGAFADSVGHLLGRIHAATARDPSIPARFESDGNFEALRLDPYLGETARRHPDLASRLEALARSTSQTKYVLVHGDVSPKNILIGPATPVLLDAEVAWFGDPAFDLAFCLNHLLIKSRVVANSGSALADAFERLTRSYLEHVDWEPRQALEKRAAALLPALALARVDGKSPVEYLTEAQRAELREAARAALFRGAETLEEAAALLRPRRPD